MNRYGITEKELQRVYEADMNGGYLDDVYDEEFGDSRLTCEQVIEMSGLHDISIEDLFRMGQILQEDDELYLDDEVILIKDPKNFKVVY